MALTLCISAGCVEDPDKNWDKRSFTVYVYLEDGATPVANVRLALCYNTELGSNCLSPAKTDAEGKVTITIPEDISFVGNPVIHFYNEKDLPEGYALPTNMVEITMNDGSKYEHALELSTRETKLILAKN